MGQTAHFDLDTKLECDRLKNAINGNLNEDCYVKSIEIVNDQFHARFQLLEGIYI